MALLDGQREPPSPPPNSTRNGDTLGPWPYHPAPQPISAVYRSTFCGQARCSRCRGSAESSPHKLCKPIPSPLVSHPHASWPALLQPHAPNSTCHGSMLSAAALAHARKPAAEEAEAYVLAHPLTSAREAGKAGRGSSAPAVGAPATPDCSRRERGSPGHEFQARAKRSGLTAHAAT